MDQCAALSLRLSMQNAEMSGEPPDGPLRHQSPSQEDGFEAGSPHKPLISLPEEQR